MHQKVDDTCGIVLSLKRVLNMIDLYASYKYEPYLRDFRLSMHL